MKRLLVDILLILMVGILLAALGHVLHVRAQNHQFLEAARAGDLERVRELLESGVDVHTRDGWSSTALSYAAASRHPDVVEELLEAGAPIDERTRHRQTALMNAAWRGHTEMVRFLLDRGASTTLVDSKGRTALELAREGGHRAVIRMLVETQAVPEEPATDE